MGDNAPQTGLVILQPTPFCNIDCSYCYLPNRTRNDRMSNATLERIADWLAESPYCAKKFTVVWHAGEPLTVPIQFYMDADRVFKDRFPANQIDQSVQTNGTLLNDEWCQFFSANRWSVGVSLDGPKWLHNRYRVERSGAGSFDKTMRGVELLQRHNVDFGILSVLTDDALSCATELWDFFMAHGLRHLAFNLDEMEGARISSTHKTAVGARARYSEFIDAIYGLWMAHPEKESIYIREIHDLVNLMKYGTDAPHSSENSPASILTIDHRGNYSTFSPELLASTDANGDDFLFGNVFTDQLATLWTQSKFQRVHAEIQAGVQACKDSCEYFELCGGGAPSNKLSENGTFASTETVHCAARVKAVSDVILRRIEEELLVRPHVHGRTDAPTYNVLT